MTKARLLVCATIAFLVFMGLAALLPTVVMVQLFNGIFLGLFFGVFVVYLPLLKRVWATPQFDRISQLILGIGLTWTALGIGRSVNVLGQIIGSFNALGSSIVMAIAAYLAILGAILHITAPGMVDMKLVYHRKLLLVAGMIALLITVITVAAQWGKIDWNAQAW